MNFEVLNKFGVSMIQSENAFDKLRVEPFNLCELLNFLKNNAEFAIDRLNTIITVDLIEDDKFELIYDLQSVLTKVPLRVSVLIDRNSPHVPSVVEIFKSAYFDECEVFDLFGVIFDKNPHLKRLLMPKGWVGNPLRKDYRQDDARLEWNS